MLATERPGQGGTGAPGPSIVERAEALAKILDDELTLYRELLDISVQHRTLLASDATDDLVSLHRKLETILLRMRVLHEARQLQCEHIARNGATAPPEAAAPTSVGTVVDIVRPHAAPLADRLAVLATALANTGEAIARENRSSASLVANALTYSTNLLSLLGQLVGEPYDPNGSIRSWSGRLATLDCQT